MRCPDCDKEMEWNLWAPEILLFTCEGCEISRFKACSYTIRYEPPPPRLLISMEGSGGDDTGKHTSAMGVSEQRGKASVPPKVG